MLQRLFQHTQQQGRGQSADSQRNQKARRVFHDRQQKQPAVRRGTPAAQQNRYEPGQCTACDAGEADPQRVAQCKRQRTLGHEGRAHQQGLRRRAALDAGEPRREQQAGQRHQTFTVNTHLQHENVLADPNRLNQVLMNILSNAVKYTPKGGHIRLEVEELPRNEHFARYRFVVQDDGIGMSEEFQKTLFDPFTREEKSGTNKVQGTGLGMAITKSIVDLMGGSISVESAPGRGTRFEVVLEFPIDAEADTVQEAQVLPEEEETASPLSGMKFLCAEDNAINAEILELLLESKGAHCKIYPNGQEIVDAFASVKPGEYDMILMDVQMPVMDGLEATRRIRSSENPLGRIIPILAMTANAFLEDMQKSKEAGMDVHLSKPVDIAALEQTVKHFRVTPPH